MGISRKFLKFIKIEHFTCFIVTLYCLFVPHFIKAQNNVNNTSITVSGKKYYQHTVIKGETIYGIAEQFHIQPKDIVLENPSAINGVHPGDVLLIPAVIPKPPVDTSSVAKVQPQLVNYTNHEILKKETLYSLAKKYNTTVGAIDSLNPELAGKGLQIGEVIRIPVATVTPGNKQVKKHPLLKDTAKALQSVQIPGVNAGKNETQAYKTLVTEQTHSDTSKLAIFNADTGKKLGSYNIGLIMPFADNGFDSILVSRLLDGTEQIPLTTHISVDFYHGIQLALDSLAKKGLKANLFVFNILSGPDSSYHTTDFILKNPDLIKMDLIIGPPFPSNYKRVAKLAALHHIPIVSPLSGENSVLINNFWTSKATPSALTEIEAEAEFAVSHYSHAHFIIIHTKDLDNEYFEEFKKSFTKADSANTKRDSLHTEESSAGLTALKSKIVKNLVNVIIVPYQEKSFVAKFINELANAKFVSENSVVLFGMHNWGNNEALQPANLDTLDFHFPSNEFVNYADTITKIFIVKYRYDYLSEPSYYSFEGYDAGMFYGNLLLTFGTNIQNHLGDTKYRGLQTSFDMFRTSPINGYENKAVYILEYVNFTEKVDLR